MKITSYLLGSVILILTLTVVASTIYIALTTKTEPVLSIRSFLDCKQAGYTISNSNPPLCTTPDGKKFTGEVTLSEAPLPEHPSITASNSPIISSPHLDQKIASPVTITGSVVGSWYFEASFPVILTDTNGNILTQTTAQALSDWMSTSSVPFSTTLSWATTTATSGILILKKDNPSGMPEYDQQVSFPVFF